MGICGDDIVHKEGGLQAPHGHTKRFDFLHTCSRLRIKSEFRCKDLNPDKLQPSEHLIVLHMALLMALLFPLVSGGPSFTDKVAPCCILISLGVFF